MCESSPNMSFDVHLVIARGAALARRRTWTQRKIELPVEANAESPKIDLVTLDMLEAEVGNGLGTMITGCEIGNVWRGVRSPGERHSKRGGTRRYYVLRVDAPCLRNISTASAPERTLGEYMGRDQLSSNKLKR
jgi:hypothetical protein